MEVTKKPTILLGDELGLIRDGIASLCEGSGCYSVVGLCCDGTSLLERALSDKPDLVLIGCTIPKLFSLEVIRKAREAGSESKFILLLAKTDRKLALEGLRSGASGVVLKSSSSSQLLESLAQVTAGSIFVSPELEFAKLFTASKSAPVSDPLESLSSREYQVFTLLIDGYRAKEIAARLDLSPKTIDTYRASLMRKLDIHDVANLVKFAVQRELATAS